MFPNGLRLVSTDGTKGEFMTLRNIGFAGAGLLLIGLFVPIASMPMVGNINLMVGGLSVPSLCLLALAGLRPNYIWQQVDDQFYTAKSVPSEWKPGNAQATITEVEFEA